MSMIDDLKELGVNTEEALNRFMKNSALYERMLGKLPKAVENTEVMQYLESEDLSNALANAHTLKGVTGNLSITPLYTAYSDICTFLRDGDGTSAKKILERTIPLQNKIIETIKRYSE